MRYKLLFSIRDFRQGGVPRCLQSLLQYLDTNKYEVQLFVMHQDGPYRGNMPNCAVLPEDKVVRSLLTYRADASLWDKVLKGIRTIGRKFLKWNMLEWRFRKIARKIDCDVAIAYSEGFPAQFIQYFSNSKKIVWVHNDYRYDAQAGDGTPFRMFDKIICCSHSALGSLVELYPNLNDRAIAIHNLVNFEKIRAMSLEEENEIDRTKTVIVSIGRIDYPKHFDIIPQIAAQLKDRMDFNWYIIGDGPQSLKEEVLRAIEKYDVLKEVHLLGSKDNPYKYMRRADVMAVTSRFECYPTVVNEALVLGVPVVMNDIPVASEMLSPPNGIITDYEHFADAIVAAKSKIVEFEVENQMIIKQLEKLFG